MGASTRTTLTSHPEADAAPHPRLTLASHPEADAGVAGKARHRSRTVLAALLALLVALATALPAVAAWPVASSGSYVSRWSSSGHRAIDIASRAGSLIVPIRAGTVAFAGWKSNCGGWQVWVNHGDGLYSAYYHLKVETTYRGERLGDNTVLGSVGRSGCASGTHLHVEVWKGYPWRSGSYRVNPWGYIDSGRYLPLRYA